VHHTCRCDGLVSSHGSGARGSGGCAASAADPVDDHPDEARATLVLGQDVQRHRSQQNQSFDDLDVVRVDAEVGQPEVEHAHDEPADHRAGDRADAAGHRGTADEHGGDRVELEAHAVLGVRGVEVGREDHARDRGQEAHVDHREEVDAAGVDPGEAGRVRVAADGVDVASEHRALGDVGVEDHEGAQDETDDGHALVRGEEQPEDEHEAADDDELEHAQHHPRHLHAVRAQVRALAQLEVDDDRDGQEGEHERGVVVPRDRAHLRDVPVGDLLEALRDGDRLRVEDDEVQAAEEEHAGERDDEGRDADVGDPEALPDADEDPERQPEEDRRRPGQVELRHRQCDGRPHEGAHRADRQVDVTGDDHHHHADGQDEDVAVLHEQRRDVAWLEEEPVGQDLEHRHEQQESDHHAVLADVATEGVPDVADDGGSFAGALPAGCGGGLDRHLSQPFAGSCIA
jgi:hypothetical protein